MSRETEDLGTDGGRRVDGEAYSQGLFVGPRPSWYDLSSDRVRAPVSDTVSALQTLSLCPPLLSVGRGPLVRLSRAHPPRAESNTDKSCSHPQTPETTPLGPRGPPVDESIRPESPGSRVGCRSPVVPSTPPRPFLFGGQGYLDRVGRTGLRSDQVTPKRVMGWGVTVLPWEPVVGNAGWTRTRLTVPVRGRGSVPVGVGAEVGPFPGGASNENPLTSGLSVLGTRLQSYPETRKGDDTGCVTTTPDRPLGRFHRMSHPCRRSRDPYPRPATRLRGSLYRDRKIVSPTARTPAETCIGRWGTESSSVPGRSEPRKESESRCPVDGLTRGAGSPPSSTTS